MDLAVECVYKKIKEDFAMKKRIMSFIMVLAMSLSLLSFLGMGTASVKAAGSYQTWKQYDSAWGNKMLQTKNMATGGCRVTAMAMLLVKAGWKSESNFDPGVALDLFKQTGVVINGNMSEGNISKAVSGFHYCGSKNLQPMSRTDTINFIKNLYNQGYYCELLVKNGGHAVALESVVGNTINVVDPGYGARNAFDVYSLWSGSGINHVFWFSGSGTPASPVIDNNNPGSPYSVPARNLSSGSSGNDVKWVQQGLNEMIGASLSVDGIYGNATAYAVKVFQSNYGLTADGIVGTNTTNKMLEIWRAAKNKDTQEPTISEVSVSEVSLEGYRVSCTVMDNVGVTEVLFPTWTIKGGQDDLIWHKGSISGNKASFYVKAGDHKDGKGNYITHIYAKDAVGNQGFADAGVTNLSQLGSKQDLGDDFYGVIQNTTTQTVLQNTGQADPKNTNQANVVQAYRLSGAENQLWHFQKMKNGSYEITSLSDNKKLDYYGGRDITGTQVWAYIANGSDGQRWYFYKAADGVYYIQGAVCEDTLLDLYGCNNNDAANLVVHTINKSNAQKFAVKKYYKVSFLNDGAEVKTEWVAEGKSITAPDLNREGYTLSWDQDLSDVRNHITVNAVWTKKAEPEKIPDMPEATAEPDEEEWVVPTEEPDNGEGGRSTAKPSEGDWMMPTAEPSEGDWVMPTAEPNDRGGTISTIEPDREIWTVPTEFPNEKTWRESPTKKPGLSVNEKNNDLSQNEEKAVDDGGVHKELPESEKQGTEKKKLSKPVIKKLSNRKGGKVVVEIGKSVTNAQGYQIRYSTRKSMDSAKKVKIRGQYTLGKTIKKLKKNKKYYFRVRAYRTLNEKTYYSHWSACKSVKVRK